ncbi:hypothetical protein Q5752_006246 [Cryptotrichosporon argae]
MSYHARRVHGRFTTNTASEAYQRQLFAPVKKWRRGWVTPKGLPEGRTYKICRWVRADDLNEDGTPLDEDDEGDDDDEGDEDEGEGEGEDGDEGDEGNGDDAEDGDDDVPPTATGATATATASAMEAPTPAAATPAPPVVARDAPKSADTPADAGAALPAGAPKTQGVEVRAAPPVEEGLGDLGAGGVEVAPVAAPAPAAAIETEPSTGTAASEAAAPEGQGAEAASSGPASTAAEYKMDVDALQAVEHDPGLVMGEMAPPVEAMAVDGEDQAQPPREIA